MKWIKSTERMPEESGSYHTKIFEAGSSFPAVSIFTLGMWEVESEEHDVIEWLDEDETASPTPIAVQTDFGKMCYSPDNDKFCPVSREDFYKKVKDTGEYYFPTNYDCFAAGYRSSASLPSVSEAVESILAWYNGKGDQYRNDTLLSQCAIDYQLFIKSKTN